MKKTIIAVQLFSLFLGLSCMKKEQRINKVENPSLVDRQLNEQEIILVENSPWKGISTLDIDESGKETETIDKTKRVTYKKDGTYIFTAEGSKPEKGYFLIKPEWNRVFYITNLKAYQKNKITADQGWELIHLDEKRYIYGGKDFVGKVKFTFIPENKN